MKNFYFYNARLSIEYPNILVCFHSGTELCFETFRNEVAIQFKSSIFTRSLIFITPSFNKEDIKNKLFSSNAQLKIKEKINSFQELNFHICFIDRTGNFELKDFNPDKKKIEAQEIEKVIKIGLYNIIINRNLIIEAHSNIHFIKPSKKHSSKFIDVKNLLESSSETSFIATCLLKLIPSNINKIYVDTSGIYPLAYELSNITRAFDKSFKTIPIDSFGSYGGIDEYTFSSDANTLVLISASTSNGLLKELRTDPSLNQASIVSIIMTQVNEDKNVLIKFEDYKIFDKSYFKHFESYAENDCPMCLKEHSIPIKLDKSRFVFDAPRTESYLPVSTDSDKHLKELISKYKDSDIFHCLFNGSSGAEPASEYFIDVSKAMDHSNFRELINLKIQRFFPLNTRHIIHCKDEGAKKLAIHIKNSVSHLSPNIDLHESGSESINTMSFESELTKGIIVVAGSLESGKSLLNISRALRKYHGQPITYLIGFAKYNSEIEFNKLKKDLEFSEAPCGHHQLHVIEKVILPINEHKENSWEKELELLKNLKAKHHEDTSLNEVINNRDQQLKSASDPEKKGLGKELFIPSPDNKHLILGKSFAFWNKEDNSEEFDHHATVYFTISSILQKLRTTENKNGIKPLGDGYIIRQLDPLLFDRFNEGIIQASVLRSAKPRELDYSGDDIKSRIVGSLIERMLKSPEDEESTGLPEFLLALCTKKLQVKKDHLLGFYDHKLNKTEQSMAWMLAEYARELLLEKNTEDSETTDKSIPF